MQTADLQGNLSENAGRASSQANLNGFKNMMRKDYSNERNVGLKLRIDELDLGALKSSCMAAFGENFMRTSWKEAENYERALAKDRRKGNSDAEEAFDGEKTTYVDLKNMLFFQSRSLEPDEEAEFNRVRSEIAVEE